MTSPRLAEEIVLWATKEFGFVRLDDATRPARASCPRRRTRHRRNRPRPRQGGRLLSATSPIVTTLKSLPLAYNRDLWRTGAGVRRSRHPRGPLPAFTGWSRRRPLTERLESLCARFLPSRRISRSGSCARACLPARPRTAGSASGSARRGIGMAGTHRHRPAAIDPHLTPRRALRPQRRGIARLPRRQSGGTAPARVTEQPRRRPRRLLERPPLDHPAGPALCASRDHINPVEITQPRREITANPVERSSRGRRAGGLPRGA